MCDYGGLVNDTEIMTKGFLDLGHSVSNIILAPKSYGLKIGKGAAVVPRMSGYEVGVGTGLWIHHKSGFLGMDSFGFAEKSSMKEWKRYTSRFDLIIHHTPVPTLRKEYKGIDTWKLLYRIKVPQIAISPDANFRDSYPHAYEIVKHLKGVACTHEAGYEACKKLPTRRVLLPGPHIIDIKGAKKRSLSKRKKGFVSIQNFKPIKHVDDLIRSIPFMKKGITKVVAGGGIEYHYMTSENKVKPKYLDKEGNKIWDVALENGMKFVGYIPNEKRDTIMSEVNVLVDCSWSNKYSALGPHFNRTFIEAMKNGCVPTCTDLGMDGSKVFTPGENYIRIPAMCTPKERAGLLEEAMSDEKLLKKIRNNNLKLLPQFDYLSICQGLIDLGTKKSPCGIIGEGEVGKEDKEIKRRSKLNMEFFK